MLIRDLLLSNLKKAEINHKKAVYYAQKGDYDKAKLHLEIANLYRQRINNLKKEK